METSPPFMLPQGAGNRKKRTPDAQGERHTRKGPFGGERARSSLGKDNTGRRLVQQAKKRTMTGCQRLLALNRPCLTILRTQQGPSRLAQPQAGLPWARVGSSSRSTVQSYLQAKTQLAGHVTRGGAWAQRKDCAGRARAAWLTKASCAPVKWGQAAVWMNSVVHCST